MGKPKGAKGTPLNEDNDPSPPPYPGFDIRAASALSHGAGSSNVGAISGVKSAFPPALNAYHPMKITNTFYLAEQGETPLFHIETHYGLTGKPPVVLHSGPIESSPVIGTAKFTGMFSMEKTVLSIPTQEGALASAQSGVQYEMQSIDMRAKTSWRKLTPSYPFAVEVGVGKDVHREEFEWRSSHGDEVKTVDGWKYGWKLVRLSSEGQPSGSTSSKSKSKDEERKEVVAAWARNASWSMTKAFTFQFVGNGVTGMLGERWQIAAITSALMIYYIEQRQLVKAVN